MKTRNMAQCALFAALLVLCAWLCVPVGDAAFTLQTLGVSLTLLLLGGKRGTLAIGVYLLLGMVGLPVFSGFQGGMGALMGATGGYILGFLIWCGVYWLLTALLPDRGRLPGLVLGLLACYVFGSFWFYRFYLSSGAGLAFVVAKCVVPYLLPDGVKLTAAWFLAQRLKRFVY